MEQQGCLGFEREEPKSYVWHCSLCGYPALSKLSCEVHINMEHPNTDAYPFEQEV